MLIFNSGKYSFGGRHCYKTILVGGMVPAITMAAYKLFLEINQEQINKQIEHLGMLYLMITNK